MELDLLRKENEYLAQFINDERKATLASKLHLRSNFLTVVMENFYQPHNASAVLRTCDCFGVQRAHIVNDTNPFLVQDQVSHGAEKWVEQYEYDSSESCLNHLKKQGYLIACTDLDGEDLDLDKFQLTQKTAIVFGTEWTGTSDVAKSMADIKLKIPMYGFTQSFNVSVSAAIILHQLNKQLRHSSHHYNLSELEVETALNFWYKQLTPVRLDL